jgi:hypothetical protein
MSVLACTSERDCRTRATNENCTATESWTRTKYLYVYSAEEQTVLRFLHVYDSSRKVDVAPGDVEVMWATGGTKCGVAIWGKMRGIIDLAGGGEGRVWLEGRDTPGIGDQKWLEGF